jgi:release factor glutamine methyltransferase
MKGNIQTIKDIKSYLLKELAEIYPQSEITALSNIIIKTLFKVSGLHVLTMPQDPVTKKQADRIISICRDLKRGKPIQHILGETSFYNCTIKVTPEVLIPRPETEELVDLIIKENKDFRGSILDIGTGSGCIAIALAVNLPGSKVTGIDNIEEAIRISQENGRLNNTSVSFLKNDIFKSDLRQIGNVGIIVSNPPYVRESEKKLMAGNVLEYEPPSALFVSDSDPLVYYNAILRTAEVILIRGGKIYFEINEAMGEPMVKLMNFCGYSGISVVKDINDKDRIVKAVRY